METIHKKLEQIEELVKNLGKPKTFTPVSPKAPTPPKPPSIDDVKPPEAPKANQGVSKKDPKKMAEQLKDPDLKDQAMKEAKKLKEGVKFTKSGQWYLDTIEDDSEMNKVFPVPSSP